MSYAEVGATRQFAPAGYAVDHNRIPLGKGLATFHRAVDAIRQWKMFQMPWLTLCWTSTPIEVGATVAVLASHLGLEFHADDETVWYDLYAFSRPRGLARLAYPFSRTLQGQFIRDSKDAILRAVKRS